ncbi:MAG: DUF2294 domain-containing protein [bacterium]|nr:DUF2294 domain-containing protein [bacterium]
MNLKANVRITKGQIEAKISEAIIKFEKEYMGRGPEETKTYIMKDVIFIRLKKVLTPAEEQLSKSASGAELIKKVRIQLLENARDVLEKIIYEITGGKVISLHTDISTRTGERIIVFTLDREVSI